MSATVLSSSRTARWAAWGRLRALSLFMLSWSLPTAAQTEPASTGSQPGADAGVADSNTPRMMSASAPGAEPSVVPEPAPGSPKAPSRAIALAPLDDTILKRLHGQIGDLAWSLELVHSAANDPYEPTSRAAVAARREGARVVIWVDAQPDGGVVLHLYEADQSRLLERSFLASGQTEALAASANAEALALVVRSSLRAISEGDVVGEVVVVAETSEPSAVAQAKPTPVPGPDRLSSPAIASPGPWALALALGVDLVADGHSPITASPSLRFGIRHGAVELGLQLQLGLLAAEIEDDNTRISIERRALELGLALNMRGTGAVDAAVGLWAGAVEFRRKTQQVDPSLSPTPDQDSLGFSVGVEGRLLWTWWQVRQGSLGLEVAAGASLLPQAPILRYEGGRDRRLWPIQPFLRVGIHSILPI